MHQNKPKSDTQAFLSIPEREIWMASHQAPPGALMVYKDELQSMALSVRRLADMNQDLLRVLSPFLVSENDSPITAIRRILKDLASTKAKLAEASKGAQEKPLNHSMD